MSRWLTLCTLLASLTLSAQPSTNVIAEWNLHPSHDGASFELEVDGTPRPCAPVVVLSTTRRCGPVAVTSGVPHTFRLRGLIVEGAGEWSGPVSTGGLPPGPFTITLARELSAPPKGPGSKVATVAQSWGNTNGAGNATSLQATSGGAVTSGRTLIAMVSVYDGASGPAPSVSGISGGGTWTQVNRIVSAADALWAHEIWKCVGNSGGNPLAVTASINRAGYISMAVIEVADSGDTAGSNTQENTSTPSPNTGAAVTPSADGIHLTFMGYAQAGHTYNAASGWSNVIKVDEANGNGGPVIVASRAATNGVSQTPNWTGNSGSYASLINHVVVSHSDGGGGGGSILLQMLQQH